MKLVKISIFLILILFVVFIGFQLYFSLKFSDIETYPYKTIQTSQNIELRAYEPGLFTSVTLPGSRYEEVSGQGFGILAGYIFGGNAEKQEIAMTSPVSMSLEDSIEMMFMVPLAYGIKDLPEPNDKDIQFVKLPARKMAAIRFGGWSDDEKIAQNKNQLISYLDQQNIPYTDHFFYFGYNAPFEIFNRRNEVLVELEWLEHPRSGIQ